MKIGQVVDDFILCGQNEQTNSIFIQYIYQQMHIY